MNNHEESERPSSGRFQSRVVALLALVALGGCTGSNDGDRGPDLIVNIGPNRGTCVVRGAEIKCADVPRYLRDALNVGTDTYISVRSRAAEDARYDVMSPVMDALNGAGYTRVIGSIEIDDHASGKAGRDE